MKKILALLLAIVMVIGLAACGGEQTAEPTKKPTSTNTEVSADGRLPLTTTGEKLVLGICQNSKVTSYDDNYLTLLLEEKTGVDIEFMYFAAGQADARKQLGLMVAGKEKLPDIIVGMLDDAMRSELGNDGVLIDCTPYLEDRDFFYYGSMYLDVATEEELNLFWNRYKDPISGAIYGIPSVNYGGVVDVCGFLGGLNNDFAKALGINPDEIDTVDELHDYLTRVVTEDPNGNGENDELGILYFPNGNRSNIEQWIVNAYVYWNEGSFFNVTDGKVWEPYSTKEFRDAFKVLYQWYQEGLIADLSFDISEAGEMKQILEKDVSTVGVFGGHPTVVCSANGNVGKVYTNLNTLQAETEQGGYTVLRATLATDMNVSITNQCKNPDLAFKFLDHNLNPEIGPVFRYGEPGVNWYSIEGKITLDDGSTVDVYNEIGEPAGYHVVKDEWSTETRVTWHSSMNKMWVEAGYKSGLTHNGSTYGGFAYYFTPGTRDELTWKNVEERKEGIEPAEKFFNVSYNDEEMEIVTDVQKTLQATLNTWRAEFITGVKNPNNDDDWADFLADLEEKGMYDWMDAAQDAYDRFVGKE